MGFLPYLLERHGFIAFTDSYPRTMCHCDAANVSNKNFGTTPKNYTEFSSHDLY